MRVLLYISDFIIPAMFVCIILYGLMNRVKVFDHFVEGARDGFTTVLNIMPTIIGLLVAVGVMRASGALDLLVWLAEPFARRLDFPEETLPLVLTRLISSSAATGLLIDIFENHGPDSFIGRFVSVMMSSTETVFYTMSVYFMAVKVTKTRYTLAGALFANFVGVAAALMLTRQLYS
ncbi:MAG: spore maturation protein [Defluviitaleaceae bacterium]|nr:spore maturation protein [Defluviitaleaceae bacterium]